MFLTREEGALDGVSASDRVYGFVAKRMHESLRGGHASEKTKFIMVMSNRLILLREDRIRVGQKR